MSEPRIVTFEGELTEEERKSLAHLRGTEPFRLLRKLLGQEYAKVSSRLTEIGTDRDLTMAQGQLVGIKSIYNLLLTLGVTPIQEKPLPKHLEILQNASKRGS